MRFKNSKKIGILLCAFGVSSQEGKRGISHFDAAVRQAYPDYAVRWAFTSEHLRICLARQRVKSDSVKKALWRFHYEQFSQIAVQSLHLIPGLEFEQLYRECTLFERETGMRISVGQPLLSSQEAVVCVGKALLGHLPEERSAEEPIIFIGHGSRHGGGKYYAALWEYVHQHDKRIFLGTLTGEAKVETLLPELLSLQERHLWLLPFLSIIGRHALIDIAGAVPYSWNSILTVQGFRCSLVVKGIAEYRRFIAVWLSHLKLSVQLLSA